MGCGIKLSLEAQLETALLRILRQDDVAVWSREIKLVINRWNMYEPFRPAPLWLSGRHFIKEHSASTPQAKGTKLKAISAQNPQRKPAQ
jgi:hypothetical protein